MQRYVSHRPDDHDGDPHIYDVLMGEVVEAILETDGISAAGRAEELNIDSSSDPRFNVDGFTLSKES